MLLLREGRQIVQHDVATSLGVIAPEFQSPLQELERIKEQAGKHVIRLFPSIPGSKLFYELEILLSLCFPAHKMAYNGDRLPLEVPRLVIQASLVFSTSFFPTRAFSDIARQCCRE